MKLTPPPGAAYVALDVKDQSGRSLPYVVPKCGRAKRCRALSMIIGDLKRAASNLETILQDRSHDLNEMRWHDAVISYGRNFVSADGRGTKLEEQHVKDLGSKFLSTHREVMELRHQYVAHAGKNEQQRVFVALILEPASGHPKINGVMIQEVTEVLTSSEHLQQFKELCDKLVQSTEVLLNKATDVLIAHYQAMTFEQLHKATQP